MELPNLNELTWQKRGQWPVELKIISCILVAAVAFWAIYHFLATPEFEYYDKLEVEEAALRRDFDKKYNQIVNLEIYHQQLIMMQARFGALIRELPTANEMPHLLEEISKTGTNLGLTFDLFAPKKEVIHPFYIELPVDIVVRGTYHQFAVFLSGVAKINRIVTLHDFLITKAKESDNTPLNEEQLSTERLLMSITIKIYRYRS